MLGAWLRRLLPLALVLALVGHMPPHAMAGLERAATAHAHGEAGHLPADESGCVTPTCHGGVASALPARSDAPPVPHCAASAAMQAGAECAMTPAEPGVEHPPPIG